MAQYKGASRDAHRAKTLEKRRERQKEEMELLKNKLAKVSIYVMTDEDGQWPKHKIA